MNCSTAINRAVVMKVPRQHGQYPTKNEICHASCHTGSKNRRLKIISFPPEFEMKFHIYFALLLLSKNFGCCCLTFLRGRI